MSTPVRPIDPEVAERLNLGKPGYRCIGFWRHDPSTDPAKTAAGIQAKTCREAVARSDRNYTTQEADEYETRAEYEARLPWPGDHVDPNMSVAERERVARLLDAAPVLVSYRGSSWDRLDPARPRNGSCERHRAGYVWPSGLSHYVRAYGLVLDADFIAAIEAADDGTKGPIDPGVGNRGLPDPSDVWTR